MTDVCNRSDCIIKNPLSEMKGWQENESITGVRDRQKNPYLRITVWHHSASLMMPDSNPRDRFFYLSLTPMIDSYNISKILSDEILSSILSRLDFFFFFFLDFFFCFFFFFFFDLGFMALSRIFHLYQADRSSKVGETGEPGEKSPDHP